MEERDEKFVASGARQRLLLSAEYLTSVMKMRVSGSSHWNLYAVVALASAFKQMGSVENLADKTMGSISNQ